MGVCHRCLRRFVAAGLHDLGGWIGLNATTEPAHTWKPNPVTFCSSFTSAPALGYGVLDRVWQRLPEQLRPRRARSGGVIAQISPGPRLLRRVGLVAPLAVGAIAVLQIPNQERHAQLSPRWIMDPCGSCAEADGSKTDDTGARGGWHARECVAHRVSTLVAAPGFEETYFRGLLFHRIAATGGGGLVLGAAASVTAFVAGHAEAWRSPQSAAVFAASGLVFTGVYAATGGSLVAAIATHMAFNLMSLDAVTGGASHGLRLLAYERWLAVRSQRTRAGWDHVVAGNGSGAIHAKVAEQIRSKVGRRAAVHGLDGKGASIF